MKRLLMCSLSLLLWWEVGSAQGTARATPTERQARFEAMAEELQLTPEQREEILLLQEDTREQMRILRESGASREEMMMRLRELRLENEAWMQEILTKGQFAKYQQMIEERRERRGRRPGRGGNG